MEPTNWYEAYKQQEELAKLLGTPINKEGYMNMIGDMGSSLRYPERLYHQMYGWNSRLRPNLNTPADAFGHYIAGMLNARDEVMADNLGKASVNEKLKEPQVIKKGTPHERQIKKETRTPKLSTNANNIMLTTSQTNNPVRVIPKQEIVYNVPQGTKNITPKVLTLADKAYNILKNPTTYTNLGGGIIEGLLLNEALKRAFNNPWQVMSNPKPDTRSETDKAIMRARFGI